MNTSTEINIKIKDSAPCDYMGEMRKQLTGEGLVYGGITTEADLTANLAENCVPEEFATMDIWGYPLFLEKRRALMAQYMRDFYEHLD